MKFLTSLKRHDKERGFTLVEILVSIVLLALLTSGVTAVILSLTNTTQNFVASATTQNQASDAVSQLTRDISNATAITYADDYRIDFTTAENNTTASISYFYWTPDSSGPPLPSGVNTANLPNKPALVEYRKPAGSLNGASTILVTGYNLNQQTTVLFTYFNKANQDMVTPVTGNTLNSIQRVQYQFSLKVVNRNALIQMASSATPRYSATAINNGGNGSNYAACYAPTLSGTLPATTKNATLTWTQVNNANTYTLYRQNVKQKVNPQVIAVINNYATTSYLDTTGSYGEKYTYYIIAGCAVGTSPASNNVQLTITPAQAVIINENTTKQLTDTKATVSTPLLTDGTGRSYAASEPNTYNPVTGQTYTVARGLTNQITWASLNGAEGYLVYRDGTQIANVVPTLNSYQDTGRAYGDTATYNVIGYNTGSNGSGGNGVSSASYQLISPPKSSTITVTADDTSSNSTTSNNIINITSRAANTTGFTTQRDTTTGGTASCSNAASSSPIAGLAFTGSTVTDSTVNWASSSCYIVTGYNDAGPGPGSNAGSGVIANQLPGKFNMTNASDTSLRNQITAQYGFNSNVTYTNAAMNISWSSATGASSYSVRKQITASAGSYLDSSDQTDSTGTTTGINYGNVTPGTQYLFTVNAVAPSGAVRMLTYSYVTAPDVPAQSDNIMQSRAPAPTHQRLVTTALYTVHGMASTIYSKVWFDAQGEPGYQGFTASGGTSSVYSGGANSGSGQGRVISQLNYGGWLKNSFEVSFTNLVKSSSCTTACGSNYSPIAEQAPDYDAGHHSFYTEN